MDAVGVSLATEEQDVSSYVLKDILGLTVPRRASAKGIIIFVIQLWDVSVSQALQDQTVQCLLQSKDPGIRILEEGALHPQLYRIIST